MQVTLFIRHKPISKTLQIEIMFVPMLVKSGFLSHVLRIDWRRDAPFLLVSLRKAEL